MEVKEAIEKVNNKRFINILKQLEDTIREFKQEIKDQKKIETKLIGDNMRYLLKSKGITYDAVSEILGTNISYIATRISGNARFSEEEIKKIEAIPKNKKSTRRINFENIYVKYNKKQYEISNINDYNKMNEKMAQLLMELLNEMEELL